MDPSNLYIWAQDADNPGTFSDDDFDISSRPKTTENAHWSPGDWLEIGDSEPEQKTSNFANVLQEVVDRGGFSAQSAVVIIITGEGKRTAISYNQSGRRAPKMCVNYTIDDDLFGTPTAEDNCSNVTITHEDTETPGCPKVITRTWTATDDCGNASTASQSIHFKDNVSPVFTSVPEGEIISCDDFPPTFGPVEVEDNCDDNVTITFEDKFLGGSDEDSCDDGINFDYRRIWTATDACGNTSTAKQTFWIKQNEANLEAVSGTILTEENEMVDNVTVHANGSGINIWQTTEEDGHYGFDLPYGGNFDIEPYRNDHPLNGVSTADLIFISMHILGMDPLDSPYDMIAADANNSGNITSADLVEIRKLILFMTEEFSNNTSWRFVDANYVFPNEANPFAYTFPELYSINGLEIEEIADFIAIKTGDVTGNAIASEYDLGDLRSEGEMNFVVNDELMKAGEDYQVAFTSKDFNSILGYQFTLNFDEQVVDFVDVEAGVLKGLSQSNFGYSKLAQGAITASWNETRAFTSNEEEVLFTLTFRAKTTAQLSEVLSISSRYTKAEAYNEDAQPLEIGLKFNTESGIVPAANFKLYQNQPNPFKDNTVIGFDLPTEGEATITIYDVSGRVLKQYTGDFAKGYNQVSLNKADFGQTGMMYYTLETATDTATKKMILIAND